MFPVEHNLKEFNSKSGTQLFERHRAKTNSFFNLLTDIVKDHAYHLNSEVDSSSSGDEDCSFILTFS